jgi:flagellin
MIINTNAAAEAAIYNLDKTNVNLKRSLTRLSSGLRINSAQDDAAGLAVSLKLSAAIRRTDSASANVGNALSFLQSQDGVLAAAGSILDRMSELATLATDESTTTDDDRELYKTEFEKLAAQLTDFTEEEFNGIPLFSLNSDVLVVRTSENGSQTTGITQVDLEAIAATVSGLTVNMTDAALALTAVEDLDTEIQNLAVLRATNGAQQSRLSFAQDILGVNRLNLEAANSQIMDADLARESTEFAKHSIIANAGVAMLAQANMIPERAMKLLEFN